MSFSFILGNAHFTVELLGTVVFMAVAWLALDAARIRADFATISRGIGFMFLAGAHLVHAFNWTGDIYNYLEIALFSFGLLFIIINMVKELPEKRLTLPGGGLMAIVVLPAFAGLRTELLGLLVVEYGVISFLSFRQYIVETKKAILPFSLAFLFLMLGMVARLFSGGQFDTTGAVGHLFELAGFLSLGVWVWQYLQLRIREELALIFVSMAVVISTLVTLVFSSILADRIEGQLSESLLTDTRVLELAVDGLKSEALAKVRFVARDNALIDAVAVNDMPAVEKAATDLLSGQKLGFLSVVEANGDVLLRANATTQRGDNVSDQDVFGEAIAGDSAVSMGSSPAEGFAIRAAAPLLKNGQTVGVVIAGFPLDNVFADQMQGVTGLDMSVHEGARRVATSEIDPITRSRAVGVLTTDKAILDPVLKEGRTIVLRTTILSRPYLAGYAPVRDMKGNVIGMLSATKPQQEVSDIANQTNRFTFMTVVVMMLILVVPMYSLTKRLSQEIA